MQLKRLWDTEGKKIVFAEWPSGHMCQVWTDETWDHLYIYDKSQWLSYNGTSPAWMEYDRSNWVELVDQEVWFYDTNEPTDLYSWDSGDKASYKFVDWDGTVLKSGVVEEWETPTAPADPTRAATAQYTYTFAGWNPTVWPISKKTTFTATYTATVNEYTITWVDWDGNTLDTDTVAYGDTPEYTWATPTKTATAQYTYTWDEWWTPSVVAVTWDATYTATFTATVNQYTVTIQSNNTDYGTVDESSVTVDYGTAISSEANVLTIGETEVTATAETGYQFSSWGTLPATVTETLTITATFQAEWYTLTFTPRDSTNNQEWWGTISPNQIVVPTSWASIILWLSDSADSIVSITGEPDINITPTPDSWYGENAWYYWDENSQQWVYWYNITLQITGNMSFRYYFTI